MLTVDPMMLEGIDAGEMSVQYGGRFSNWDGNDVPALQVRFLGADEAVLGEGVVLSSLANTWTLLSTIEPIPSGTKTLQVVLSGTRNSGVDNDSYVDALFVRVVSCAE